MIRLPQSTLPFIKALAVAVFAGTLVSCASKPQPAATPSISQTREALKRIRPGISRKELYATLPPSSPPLTLIPPNSFRGPFLAKVLEHHPLQDGYFVEVQYQRSQPAPDLHIDLLIVGKRPEDGGWVLSLENPQDAVVRISDLQRRS